MQSSTWCFGYVNDCHGNGKLLFCHTSLPAELFFFMPGTHEDILTLVSVGRQGTEEGGAYPTTAASLPCWCAIYGVCMFWERIYSTPARDEKRPRQSTTRHPQPRTVRIKLEPRVPRCNNENHFVHLYIDNRTRVLNSCNLSLVLNGEKNNVHT